MTDHKTSSFNSTYQSQTSSTYQQEEPQSYYDDPKDLRSEQRNQSSSIGQGPQVSYSNYSPSPPSNPASQQTTQKTSYYMPHVQVQSTYTKEQANAPHDLLLNGLPSGQIQQIKSQNQQRYQLRPDSVVYRLSTQYMRNLIKRFPSDFPQGLSDTVDRDIGRLNVHYTTLHSMVTGTCIYWILCRRATWFKLTGNAILKAGFIMVNLSSMLDVTATRHEYLRNTVFSNGSSFERVIQQQGINPDKMNIKELLGM